MGTLADSKDTDEMPLDVAFHQCLHYVINRGSYMSAHVLLNLSNKLGKSEKMRGLPSIISLFRNKLHTFNNTGARMLDSIYHMTVKYFCIRFFWCENV